MSSTADEYDASTSNPSSSVSRWIEHVADTIGSLERAARVMIGDKCSRVLFAALASVVLDKVPYLGNKASMEDCDGLLHGVAVLAPAAHKHDSKRLTEDVDNEIIDKVKRKARRTRSGSARCTRNWLRDSS